MDRSWRALPVCTDTFSKQRHSKLRREVIPNDSILKQKRPRGAITVVSSGNSVVFLEFLHSGGNCVTAKSGAMEYDEV